MISANFLLNWFFHTLYKIKINQIEVLWTVISSKSLCKKMARASGVEWCANNMHPQIG